MLINFIGAPASGKTTVAAEVFARCKDLGMVAEFVPEQARVYIARLRLKLGEAWLKLGETSRTASPPQVVLSDFDQVEIMRQQVEAEELFARTCSPETLIVSDCSPLNALAYMAICGPEAPTALLVSRALALNPLTFYCPPVTTLGRPRVPVVDRNRVHGEAEAQVVDARLLGVLRAHGAPEPIHLVGLVASRRQQVIRKVFEHYDDHLSH